MIERVSRLRQLVLSDRFFFITCSVRQRRRALAESEFACLAQAVRERPEKHRFLLTTAAA
ncbi:MAG TPA: hypothetical protein VL523_19795 [Terriglobia bacterium]|nr:hypothetical protein [Terriglobia bacterium]